MKKVDKELELVKVLSTLRNIKILMKNSLMTKDVLDQIKHNKKNIIDIDQSSIDTFEEKDDDENIISNLFSFGMNNRILK